MRSCSTSSKSLGRQGLRANHYPGIPEYKAELERREDGIPLHREVISWFNTTTDGLGLEWLRTKSG